MVHEGSELGERYPFSDNESRLLAALLIGMIGVLTEKWLSQQSGMFVSFSSPIA